MTRWSLRIFLFLILGAIVNVAVAWGVGFRAGGPTGTADQRLSPEDLDWLWKEYVDAPHRSGFSGWREARFASTSTEFGDCYRVSEDGTMWGIDNAVRTGVIIVDSGWPCRILHHVSQWGLANLNIRFATRNIDRDAFTWLKESRPIWPGFAINTVFYAAILWLLFAVPFALRRRRRIKRGLCPKCTYPVGTNERCTECGAAVMPVAKERMTT